MIFETELDRVSFMMLLLQLFFVVGTLMIVLLFFSVANHLWISLLLHS